MPRKRGSVLHKIPSYTTLRNLLQQIDPDALGRVLSAWFSAQAGQLPGQLAVDGKMIGTICGVVSVVDPETGVPVAMAPMRHKEEGPDGGWGGVGPQVSLGLQGLTTRKTGKRGS